MKYILLALAFLVMSLFGYCLGWWARGNADAKNLKSLSVGLKKSTDSLADALEVQKSKSTTEKDKP